MLNHEIENFIIKADSSIDTGKTYQHNFQGMDFEGNNCFFYVWHKKEIKLIESKNLGSTMSVFFIKKNYTQIQWNNDIRIGINLACQLFKAFDENTNQSYYFLPYFQTKNIESKNQIFTKLGINLKLYSTPKGVLIETESIENSKIDQLNINGIFGFLFGLVLLFGKFETKGATLSAIKIQLPLFGQYLSLGDNFKSIQKQLQKIGIFIQISENIQGDKHIYEITSNDYELLENFSFLYKSVENFSQITKRVQAQEAIESLKDFLNNRGENFLLEEIDTSCVKILSKI